MCHCDIFVPLKLFFSCSTPFFAEFGSSHGASFAALGVAAKMLIQEKCQGETSRMLYPLAVYPASDENNFFRCPESHFIKKYVCAAVVPCAWQAHFSCFRKATKDKNVSTSQRNGQ